MKNPPDSFPKNGKNRTKGFAQGSFPGNGPQRKTGQTPQPQIPLAHGETDVQKSDE